MEKAYKVFLMWVARRNDNGAVSDVAFQVAEKYLQTHESDIYLALKTAYLMGINERRKKWN